MTWSQRLRLTREQCQSMHKACCSSLQILCFLHEADEVAICNTITLWKMGICWGVGLNGDPSHSGKPWESGDGGMDRNAPDSKIIPSCLWLHPPITTLLWGGGHPPPKLRRRSAVPRRPSQSQGSHMPKKGCYNFQPLEGLRRPNEGWEGQIGQPSEHLQG